AKVSMPAPDWFRDAVAVAPEVGRDRDRVPEPVGGRRGIALQVAEGGGQVRVGGKFAHAPDDAAGPDGVSIGIGVDGMVRIHPMECPSSKTRFLTPG
ncbi:hypothetical protein NS229_10595, partial [Methylobacterium indicum]